MKETLPVFWGGEFGIHYAYLSGICLSSQPRQDILSFLLRWRSKNLVAQKYNDGGMKNIVGKRVQEAPEVRHRQRRLPRGAVAVGVRVARRERIQEAREVLDGQDRRRRGQVAGGVGVARGEDVEVTREVLVVEHGHGR